jgi:Spy/CpxP family protein refolding chaperone
MNAAVTTTTTRKARGFRKLAVGIALFAIAGAASLTVFAQGRPHGGAEMGMGPGLFMAGPRLDRMLDSVNATDAQRAQIKQIAQAAAADLKAQHQAGSSLHDQMQQLFTQPTVDANAVEALRQQMLAQHDQASKRVMQAMLDISRVLSPEQRTQLVQKMQERRAKMQQRMQEHRAASQPTN